MVIDADVLAREVVEPGTPGLAAIGGRFGDGVLTDGRLDRAGLGEIEFADPEARRDLERIVHPAVRARAAEMDGPPPKSGLVHVIPLLVETGQRRGSTSSWWSMSIMEPSGAGWSSGTDSPPLRPGRIAAQASRADRMAAADIVLDNGGTVTQLKDPDPSAVGRPRPC